MKSVVNIFTRKISDVIKDVKIYVWLGKKINKKIHSPLNGENKESLGFYSLLYFLSENLIRKVKKSTLTPIRNITPAFKKFHHSIFIAPIFRRDTTIGIACKCIIYRKQNCMRFGAISFKYIQPTLPTYGLLLIWIYKTSSL